MPLIKGPTYESVLYELANAIDRPIAVDELIRQVLERKPTTSKHSRHSVMERIRGAVPRPFVFLDSKTLLPTRLAMLGARFRMPLGRRAAESGLIEMNIFESYLPNNFGLDKVQFVDAKEQALNVSFRAITKQAKSFFGLYDQISYLADLSAWLHPQKVSRHDDLLVTVLDWQNGRLQLEIEPHRKRNAALIEERDRLLADLIYNILEDSYYEEVYVKDAIPTTYARLPDKAGCPPHHWQMVLEKDGRFRFDDLEIKYADGGLSPLERITLERTGQPLPRLLQPVTEEQKHLVYRFRAVLKYKPSIWREVEVLGDQTLSDLNFILVEVFKHDVDHLGGFWKIVPRKGSQKRFREVELGTVEPFGFGGDGADVQIAAIGLKEGDKLKYVYDFGDWIEHTLTLVSIHAAEPQAKYPRQTAQNAPRPRYCPTCKKKGKETMANWLCITCSNEHGEEVICCDDCLDDHEDHYTVRLLY